MANYGRIAKNTASRKPRLSNINPVCSCKEAPLALESALDLGTRENRMKLFTFSGISASLSGINAGLGLIEFAQAVIKGMPGNDRPVYTGTKDADHFPSYVNYGTMLGVVLDAVQLSGSTVLNEEASRLAPQYAAAMSDAVQGTPAEDVLILAHSQGTNNLTFSLIELSRTNPEFFAERSVRCALFDPKVGRNYMEQIFAIFPEEELSFLFFQSQDDLLGDQGMFIPKFITEFPHGNHIWVKGLNHGSIREWASFTKPQSWLDLFGFLEYERAYGQEVISLKQETRGGQLGTMQLLKLDKWINQYAKDEMNQDKLSEALLGFLEGQLPARFKSKST